MVVLERIEELDTIYNSHCNSEKEKTNLTKPNGSIELHNVTLFLNNKLVLKEISINFEPTLINGIMGCNGSGKTTILNLINRVYSIDSGIIKVSNQNIDDIKYHSLQENFAFVKQNPVLFDLSLIDNILLFDGSEKITQEELKNACEAVNLLDDINKMPYGFSTEFNDQNKLSVGQTQKLQIARMLLMNRPIILIDEATVNLDENSKEKIYNLFRDLSKSKTIILATNSDKDKLLCDNINYLK